MEGLNYQHLMYFWVVAREGTVTAACDVLHLAQPTISAQILRLEKSLGHQLFERRGKRLFLTDTGRTVFRYADEIFSLGRELSNTLQGELREGPLRFHVGVADVVPKLIAYQMLEPAFLRPQGIHVICHEGKTSELVSRLALHELDLVLSDTPMGPEVSVRAFNHLLGECAVTVFGPQDKAARYRRGFPKSLNDAPFLLPTSNTVLRRSLDHWFDAESIHPRVTGEFEDSALLKVFGQAGVGLFAGPTAIEREIERQYGVKRVGRITSIKEQFYAISVNRRFKHPAAIAITDRAREVLH